MNKYNKLMKMSLYLSLFLFYWMGGDLDW